ncbi:MAG TPA: ABC transporter permease [Schlesneria sp.]|jgi:phospholipid/cholesterol/gamma-HCH transport system permease protein
MSASLLNTDPTPIHTVGRLVANFIIAIGDLTRFLFLTLGGLMGQLPRSRVLWPVMYEVGVRSVPVIAVTGLFIGMVLAVQTYDTLRMYRLESRIGSVINVSLVKELGPVLAATMLAGRVGCAMAAEIGTMRVTEQIDALKALGANPISYLVVPRFLACFWLIPALTLLADGLGIFGGWVVSVKMLGVSDHFYWLYSQQFITAFDVVSGVMKSMFFGAAISIIACHRGFHCGSGAEGVGRAATDSFVCSFIAILVLDLALVILLNNVYRMLWALGFTVL